MNKNLILIEELNSSITNMIIEEHQSSKLSYLSGIMMMADVCNGNGRTYPLNEISNAVDNINKRIKEGFTVYGELNHPDNLQIDLNNVSHIITEMWVEGSNAYGKAKIIEDHPKGQIIKAILKAGGKLGVSSRGSGDVNEGMVSGFNLVTIDVVATPSAPNAYPNHVMESLLDNKKIMTLAEAIITDKRAQKYLQEEIVKFFKTIL